MLICENYAELVSDGLYAIKFGKGSLFSCSIKLWYITGTMNARDFRKMIKLIIWACEDPDIILKALNIIEDAFTITIKLSKSAPKNMKYLQEVKSKYELR